MKYFVLPTKTTVRRSYMITVALREGYSRNAVTHKPDEAISVAHQWMKEREAAGKPFLTGSFAEETLVYTWKGARDGDDAPEPAIVFRGNISVAYNPDMTDEEAKNILNDLGARLGEALNQVRVYVAYRDEIWIIQADGQTSPRSIEQK
jgi:hypothetical protein